MGTDRDSIPSCTHCRPQVASVGLTEKAAREAGHEVKIGHFPFIGNGKAIALGEPEGMIKTVFDGKTGELLGAHMVGAEVTELIQGYTIAKTLETTEADLIRTIFPHPTLSETIHEVVLDAYNATSSEPSPRRENILVHMKEVGRIVFCFDLLESSVILAVCRRDRVASLVII
jgi:hypothetical protein